MARTPGFDHDTVVRAARSLFWRTGYDTASIPDLEEATGLRRSSIYNAFGSKRGLFDAAVQSYLDEIVRPRLTPLRADVVSEHALADYLDGLRTAFAHATSMPAENGCLLVNAAGSTLVHDSAVAAVVTGYSAELRAAFARGVDAAAPHSTAADRVSLTDTVTGLVIAAFSIVRADRSLAMTLLDTARTSVTALAVRSAAGGSAA